MKIINIKEIKETINKLDSLANVDMTKPNTIFPQNRDKSVKERIEQFFQVADGKNPSWNI